MIELSVNNRNKSISRTSVGGGNDNKTTSPTTARIQASLKSLQEKLTEYKTNKDYVIE